MLDNRLRHIIIVATAAISAVAALGIIFSWNFLSVLIIAAIVVLLTAVSTLLVQPYLLIRLLVWMFMHTLYRMTVIGREHIPAAGGALLVSNAVSYIDHALLLVSLRRPARFFMGREFYENWLLHPLAKGIDAIPVDSADNPKAIGRALKEARKAIQEGHIVCIFAEGNVTRTGNMLPFGRGFEFIMRGSDAPIIPVYLDRIWGSTFSFIDGKLSWRLPKIIPYPVTVTIGAPMPAHSRVYNIRLAVQELSAAAFKLRGASQKKLHIDFVREVKRHPFRSCIDDSLGTSLSYAKVLAGMLALSEKIFPRKNDVSKEEKIGVLLPSCGAAVLVNGAIMFAGKISVNLNYTSSHEVLQSCIHQCGMKTIITSHAFLEKVNIAEDRRMIFLEDIRPRISALRRLGYFIAILFLPARFLARIFARGDPGSIDDVATIIFSSGTTGEPKGIMLTHQNISSNIEGCYQIFNLHSNDIVMCVLPFFHAFGYTATLWFPLNAGIGMVYHTNPLDGATIGELVGQFRATLMIATPTFLLNYTRKCTRDQLSSLRFVITGAEKLKQGIAEAFYNKFNVPPFEGYGASELSPVVSLGIPSYIHPKGKFVQVGNKPGTVGHPIPGVVAKVVHPESFEMLPAGERGLLLIKGPNVMKGYLNDPEKTSAVIKDGWYITGDIASIDEDGFIAITDRLSRFSKISGEMVPHIKIEEEVQSCLTLEDQGCAVTSVSDELRGERLVVLYTGNVDVDALWKKLNERDIPKLWLPKRENFFKLEKIPLLGSGKLDLKSIKEVAERQFVRQRN